ncbi:apolipoprotein N-acyltransferase [Asticcacaulis sp. EMRT-3]|uniref:apolipoprotein N-acyltransferase n=1 Tax=Asticcacaulis sp. EMRT-3 TaxID=3040349 RepID=UPI0024AF9C4E|nr:apolipoprotein N-acyltransferase [Asticcacaulis sp. EMRT-3]MDI7775678.1 apolipoprotein N-acyltransferase [Asticcacaulis sp. EMRT-3]
MIEVLRTRLSGLNKHPRLLAALSGLVIALAQPPFSFLPGLFGYALLLWILERDLGPRPKRTAFFMGWLAGFCYFLVSCFWVAEAFLVDAKTYGWMAPFAAILLPSGIGLFWGAFALVYRCFAPKGMKRFVFFACMFSTFEVMRGMILSGFPWDPAGSTWRAGDAMSQMAAFVGVYGLGFITVLVFCSVAVIEPGRKGLRGYAPVIWSALVLASCFTLGEIRLHTTPVKFSALTVRLVQPDIGQAAKWTSGNFDDLFMSYVEMSKAPPAPGKPVPDIIIWPEGALPFPAEAVFADDSWTAPVMAGLLRDNQSLILGLTRRDLDGQGHGVWRNSMLVLTRHGDQTQIEGAYNKFKLVPFGEFTPFAGLLDPLGIKALTHFDDSFTRGRRTRAMTVGSIPRFLPLICYEGIFPGLDTTKYRINNDTLRPRWIVNISNDAWFGPTTGPRQHLNLASYRAIEEGLPMIRSTPTGISVVVDPLGRVVPGSEIAMGQRGYRDVRLPDPAKVTAYEAERNISLWLITLMGLIIAGFDTCMPSIKKNLVVRFFGR